MKFKTIALAVTLCLVSMVASAQDSNTPQASNRGGSKRHKPIRSARLTDSCTRG